MKLAAQSLPSTALPSVLAPHPWPLVPQKLTLDALVQVRFSTTVAVADTVVLGGRRRHADNTDPACDANAQCSSGLGSGETEESDHSAEGRGESKSARKSKLKELSAKQAAKRANPYAWLPSCLMRYIHTADPNGPVPAAGPATNTTNEEEAARMAHTFQNPREYPDFAAADIDDGGYLGFARLLKRCIYEFVDDVRFVKVLLALTWICIFDCAIPVTFTWLFDDWIPKIRDGDLSQKHSIYKMLLGFVCAYPLYLYAWSLVISKPLDQVYMRNRLFRHALRMPWAMWTNRSAGGGGGGGGGDTPCSNDAMVTSLITEDANIVMDATCVAFDLFYTVLHLGVMLTLIVLPEPFGLGIKLIIALPPLTVHLFTFVAIETVAPRYLYHTTRRQREYERVVKEAQESLRGVSVLQLFAGTSHSTTRMLKRLSAFDTHHFAAVKLRWQIEQLPDIIAQVRCLPPCHRPPMSVY